MVMKPGVISNVLGLLLGFKISPEFYMFSVVHERFASLYRVLPSRLA